MPLTDRKNIKYVYQLPYSERMQLCRILDMNDKWEILGGNHMGFDMMTIQSLRRRFVSLGCSPTDELLQLWGHQNHTILELFVLLSKMEHYQAMLAIKNFVDSEYHRLIYEGEANLSRLFKRPNTSAPGPSQSVASVNFNQSESSNVLPSKMKGVHVSSESESKILNVEEFQASRTSTNNIHNNSNAATALVKTVIPDQKASTTSKTAKVRSEIPIGVESVGPPMIPFKELEVATNGWDNSAILGKGGFGTVYKGVWKNTPVAVKRTRATDSDENQTVQIQQILGELHMLNSYRHDNILPLYGFSVGGDDPCLIYQFMPNGSLEDRLLCRQATPPLSWNQRLSIAVGTARGLQFLHTINEKPLIHGDIKSANILLDSNYKPKIGDFGLAREGPQSHYTHMKVSRVHGTRPYLPDEFLRAKKFSTKVDTHSFGIVLYELSTGLRAYDDQRQYKFVRDLIENSNDSQIAALLDRKATPEDPQTFFSLIELGKVCVSRKPKDRPEMVLVLQQLEALESQRSLKIRTQHQHSLTPLSPYELQLMHDQLSQQRNNNVSPHPPRLVSPLPDRMTPSPTGRASPRYAPDNRMPSPVQDFPPRVTSPNGLSQNASYRVAFPLGSFKVGHVSPQPALTPPQYPETNPFQETSKCEYAPRRGSAQSNLPAQCVPMSPAIAVSPPSAHLSSMTQSTELSSVSSVEDNVKSVAGAEATELETEEIQSAYNVPFLSVLGVKEPPDEASSVERENAIAGASTAKGKSSWILSESG